MSNYNEQDFDKAMSKAKVGLMARHSSVFITTILFSLKLEITEEIPTAAVDGANLYINPVWFLAITPKQRMGLLAHESWHVAFDHISRGANMDHERFNEAADHVINLMLKSKGYDLPDGGLWDDKYTDMSTEQVYQLLPVKPKDQNPPPPSPGDWTGDLMPLKASDPDKAAKQAAMKDIVVKASTQSKMSGDDPGSIPGEIAIAIHELLNPKLSWQTILQNYMSAFSKNDYSYRKPNRRYMPEFYLPSLFSENLDEIAVAVDTSGSVSDKEFTAFLTEINDIKEKLNPSLTTIIDFDTQVNNVHSLSADEDVNSVSFTGRGGTNLQPVFDHYNKTKPTVLIVFSDLYCQQITEDPGYPVVWVVINNENAQVSFGEKIDYDTRDL